MAQREPGAHPGKIRFCLDLRFPQFPTRFLHPSGELRTVIRSIMTSIMWVAQSSPFNPIRNPFRALHELSIATTFPQSIYAQIHQHHLMCTAVQGHSYFLFSSTVHINTPIQPPSSRPGYLLTRFLHSIFSSSSFSALFESLLFLFQLQEREVRFIFELKRRKQVSSTYI